MERWWIPYWICILFCSFEGTSTAREEDILNLSLNSGQELKMEIAFMKCHVIVNSALFFHFGFKPTKLCSLLFPGFLHNQVGGAIM